MRKSSHLNVKPDFIKAYIEFDLEYCINFIYFIDKELL